MDLVDLINTHMNGDGFRAHVCVTSDPAGIEPDYVCVFYDDGNGNGNLAFRIAVDRFLTHCQDGLD